MTRKRNASHEFDWDRKNAPAHEAKAGHIPYEVACHAFDDEHALILDLGIVKGEHCYKCLGKVTGFDAVRCGRCFNEELIACVVFAFRYYDGNEVVWLISPRLARKRDERKLYYAQV